MTRDEYRFRCRFEDTFLLYTRPRTDEEIDRDYDALVRRVEKAAKREKRGKAKAAK